MNTEKMLRAFPDYGKSPPEYVASVVQVLATYPAHVQERIADLRYGLASKSKFLPTISEIVEMGDAVVRSETEVVAYAKRFSGKFVRGEVQRAPYIPFPQLWAAFESEPKLLEGQVFDVLDEACRALVRHGIDKARRTLLDGLSLQKKRAVAPPQEGQAA